MHTTSPKPDLPSVKAGQTSPTFANLGLSEKLLTILQQLDFTVPTLIQQKSIPIAVTGKDLIGIAQTGTGKTLAFALPLVQQVARTKKRGLIIVPTRELAAQVDETLRKIGSSIGLRSALLIGGASPVNQIRQLRNNPHIIIGTPGRIIDHLESRILKIDTVGVLVLDEADRMLDMGFAPQIKKILHHVPKERQTMLFSATMPGEILSLAKAYMKMPVRIEVAPSGTLAERVNQELIMVQRNQKNRLLDKLLTEFTGTVLVFARTKYGAKKICRSVKQMGHTVAEIHSNLSLAQRRKSLAGFKEGKYRVLVATDIASRGIDVINIQLVINYDLPDSPDDYVHRVGRTGRAGQAGHAISFITPDQRGMVRTIERLVRKNITMRPVPELPAEREPLAHEPEQDHRRFPRRTDRYRSSRPSRHRARSGASPHRKQTGRSKRSVRLHH